MVRQSARLQGRDPESGQFTSGGGRTFASAAKTPTAKKSYKSKDRGTKKAKKTREPPSSKPKCGSGREGIKGKGRGRPHKTCWSAPQK